MEEDKNGGSATDGLVRSLASRGDLSGMTSEALAAYYLEVCASLGLTAATQPFQLLRLNGKLVLYPTRGATDQLAAIHRLNREIVDGPKVIDVAGTKMIYAVCRATHPNGRVETAVATVPVADPLNGMMRAETKAKRRVTLSILGLGSMDDADSQEPLPGSEATLDAPSGVAAPSQSTARSSGSSAATSSRATGPRQRRSSIALSEQIAREIDMTIRGEFLAHPETPAAQILAQTYMVHMHWPEATEEQRLENEAMYAHIISVAAARRAKSQFQQEVTALLASRAKAVASDDDGGEDVAEDASQTAPAATSSAADAQAEDRKAPEAEAAAASETSEPTTSGAGDSGEVLTELVADLLRTEDYSDMAAIWLYHAPNLSEKSRRAGWAKVVARVAVVSSSSGNRIRPDEFSNMVIAEKADPTARAKSLRDFCGVRDDLAWQSYLASLSEEGHVAGAFAKRRLAFATKGLDAARETVAIARMAEVRGRGKEDARTRLRDIVRHHDKMAGRDEATASRAD